MILSANLSYDESAANDRENEYFRAEMKQLIVKRRVELHFSRNSADNFYSSLHTFFYTSTPRFVSMSAIIIQRCYVDDYYYSIIIRYYTILLATDPRAGSLLPCTEFSEFPAR